MAVGDRGLAAPLINPPAFEWSAALCDGWRCRDAPRVCCITGECGMGGDGELEGDTAVEGALDMLGLVIAAVCPNAGVDAAVRVVASSVESSVCVGMSIEHWKMHHSRNQICKR